MPTEMEKVEDVNAHLDRLGWSNGFYGRLLNVKKKAMRRWLKGEKGYSVPGPEWHWITWFVSFVDRAPSYMDDELVPYPDFLRVMWTFGFDPFGFTNYDSAAKVFDVDFFAMHDMAIGQDGVSMVPKRFATELDSLYRERMSMRFKESEAGKIVRPLPVGAYRFAEIRSRAEVPLSTVRKLWGLTQMDPLDVIRASEVSAWMEAVYQFVHTIERAGSLEALEAKCGPSDIDLERFRDLLGLMGWWLDEEENHPSFPRVFGIFRTRSLRYA